MQQPPHGRPLPGQQPQRPPAYVPPQQQGQPPYQPPRQPQPPPYQPPYQPPVQQQPPTPLPPPARGRKPRGALRFLAGTCVVSGWLTLVLSLIGAGLSFMAGASAAATLGAPKTNYFQQQPSPSPLDRLAPGFGGLEGEGGGGLTMPNPTGPLTGIGKVLQQAIPAVAFAGAIFTLMTGIVSFLLFLGLGQAFYVLIDLEEQQHRMENMLQVLTLRPGGR